MLSPLSHSRCSTNVNDLPLALCSCYKDHLTIEHHGYFETWRKNTEPGLEWECHFQNQGRRFLTAANLEINLSWWLKRGEGFTLLTAEGNWLRRRPACLALGDARQSAPCRQRSLRGPRTEGQHLGRRCVSAPWTGNQGFRFCQSGPSKSWVMIRGSLVNGSRRSHISVLIR